MTQTVASGTIGPFGVGGSIFPKDGVIVHKHVPRSPSPSYQLGQAHMRLSSKPISYLNADHADRPFHCVAGECCEQGYVFRTVWVKILAGRALGVVDVIIQTRKVTSLAACLR